MNGNGIESWRRTAETLKGELIHAKYAIRAWEIKYNDKCAKYNMLENEYKELAKVYDRTRKNLEKERAKVKFENLFQEINLEKERAKVKFENLFQEIEQTLNTIFERKTQ